MALSCCINKIPVHVSKVCDSGVIADIPSCILTRFKCKHASSLNRCLPLLRTRWCYYRSARDIRVLSVKGQITIAWPMKTFISRCYVRNASSGVVVPYTAICVLSFYYSFIVHLRGTIICFRIAVVTCVAGDALALSCGADWLWTLCRLRVVAYLFSSLEGPMNRC